MSANVPMGAVPNKPSQAPLAPVFKWAGGKRRLLPEILPRLNLARAARYVEPFTGGGAAFFSVVSTWPHASVLLNDAEPQVANLYAALRDFPEQVIAEYQRHVVQDSREYFYWVRKTIGAGLTFAHGSTRVFAPLGFPPSAGLFLYLNKACFNGLWRVNARGQYNVPYGDGKPINVDVRGLLAASRALQGAQITCLDFGTISLRPGDAVYCDPPYLPTSKTASFTGYTRAGFTGADQLRLAAWCRQSADRGARVVLSNAGNADALTCFRERADKIHEVTASRSISCKGDKRDNVKEYIFVFGSDCHRRYGAL